MSTKNQLNIFTYLIIGTQKGLSAPSEENGANKRKISHYFNCDGSYEATKKKREICLISRFPRFALSPVLLSYHNVGKRFLLYFDLNRQPRNQKRRYRER